MRRSGPLLRLIGMLLLVVLWAASGRGAHAHEVRPAYLEINQTAANRYEVVWKQPTMGEVAVHLAPHLSTGWLERPPVDEYAATSFLIRRWSAVGAATALDGAAVSIEGLPETMTDVFVRVRLLGGRGQDVILRPEIARFVIDVPQQRAMSVPSFLVLGVEHILTGPDHLLLLLGLVLLVRNRWMLLKAVTAFTAAHSLTLAIVVLANLRLPLARLDALIALSVLFLAPEILRARRGGTSLTIRHPWIVAFAFGLVHGMGFASGLTSLELARGDLAAALVLFNLGVEIGQLGFLGLVLALGRALQRTAFRWPRPVALAPAYAVGAFGAAWTIQSAATALGLAP